jgi:hypothetical protein
VQGFLQVFIGLIPSFFGQAFETPIVYN